MTSRYRVMEYDYRTNRTREVVAYCSAEFAKAIMRGTATAHTYQYRVPCAE